MKPRKKLVVVPRWSGTPAHDWYPWLVERMLESGIYDPVLIADMPDPGLPTISGWTRAIASIVGDDRESLDSTVLVGHSVGAQAVLHFLASLPQGCQVASAVFVAGWWDVDQPWDSIRPWIAHTHDCQQIRRAAKSIHVLLSDNDPFTADHETTAALWRLRLGATVQLIPAAKHFNGAVEPAVYECLSLVAAEA